MSRLLIVVPALLALIGSPAPSACAFHRDSHGWSGSCNPPFEQATTLAIAPADSITTGTWRTDARLFRQTRVGGAPSEAAARKILYWPATNRAEATIEAPHGPAPQ